jgi:DNA-binding MarR family transcriptional regulator
VLSPIPPGAPRHAQAVYLLARLGRAQSVRFAQRVESIGLRPKHFALLNAIALAEGASQQELGRRLGLDPSGLVRAIDELEGMGLAQRRRDPADRRRHALALTDDGMAALARTRRLVSEGARDLLAPLSNDEVATLVFLLGRVAHAADAAGDARDPDASAGS